MKLADALFCFLAPGLAVAQPASTYRTSQMFPGQEATGIQPLAPDTGVAPGSRLGISLTGLVVDNKLDSNERGTFRLIAENGTTTPLVVVSWNSPFDPQLPGTNSGGFASYAVVLIPYDVSSGAWQLELETDTGKLFSTRIYISPVRPGLYSADTTGAGAALVYQRQADGILLALRLTYPAAPGYTLVLSATGLGATPLLEDWFLELGSLRVPVTRIERSSGVDTIEFVPSVPRDCYVPIRLRTASVVGNTLTIPIGSEDTACEHRLGLSAEDLLVLDRGGTANLAQVSAQSTVAPVGTDYVRQERAFAEIKEFSRSGIEYFTKPLPAPQEEGCRLLRGISPGPGWLQRFPVYYYDGGDVRLRTPDGQDLTLDGGSLHRYRTNITPDRRAAWASVPEASFPGGSWQLTMSGGIEIRPFTSMHRLLPPVQLLNRGSLTRITRDADYTIAWNGSTYEQDDWMRVTLSSPLPGASPIQPSLAIIQCLAPAANGTLTISGDLLARLPEGITGLVGQLSIGPDQRSSPRTLFTGHTYTGAPIYGFTDVAFSETLLITMP